MTDASPAATPKRQNNGQRSLKARNARRKQLSQEAKALGLQLSDPKAPKNAGRRTVRGERRARAAAAAALELCAATDGESLALALRKVSRQTLLTLILPRAIEYARDGTPGDQYFRWAAQLVSKLGRLPDQLEVEEKSLRLVVYAPAELTREEWVARYSPSAIAAGNGDVVTEAPALETP